MPLGIAYNPAVHNQITTPKTANQINLVQAVQTPSFSEDKYIALGKEIKGGHYVEYLDQLLVDNHYAGILASRRQQGMLVSVKLANDGSKHNKVYQLVDYPGTNTLADWEQLGGVDIDVFNRVNVANLTERDAIVNKDIAIVADARTSAEVTAGDDVYSATFMWNGTTWLIVRTPGAVDATEVAQNTLYRHAQNTDQYLDFGGLHEIAAAAIKAHMQDGNLHTQINDAADENNKTEVFSAKGVHDVVSALISLAVQEYLTSSEIDDKIAAAAYNLPSSTTSKLGGVEMATIEEVKQALQTGEHGRLAIDPYRLLLWWGWVTSGKENTWEKTQKFDTSPVFNFGLKPGEILTLDADHRIIGLNLKRSVLENNALSFEASTNTTPTIDFSAYTFHKLFMDSNISAFKFSGGEIGESYYWSIQQDQEGNKTLKVPEYQTGTEYLKDTPLLVTSLDIDSYVTRNVIYLVKSDFTATNIDTDIDNLISHIYLPEGIMPILSTMPNHIDLLKVVKIEENKYTLINEGPDM